jgi:hypothetical protein
VWRRTLKPMNSWPNWTKQKNDLLGSVMHSLSSFCFFHILVIPHFTILFIQLFFYDLYNNNPPFETTRDFTTGKFQIKFNTSKNLYVVSFLFIGRLIQKSVEYAVITNHDGMSFLFRTDWMVTFLDVSREPTEI